MNIVRFIVALSLLLLFSGCSHKNYFKISAKKHNVNYKTLTAIASVESNHKSNVVNVNKSIFDIQRGPHYFDNWFTANLYMDMVLDPLGLNYDVGICQINKIHFDRFNLDNEDLLDDEINIDAAARIYRWNVTKCKGQIVCALSMYNTGKGNSKTGKKYANKVLRARKRLFGK
ncbi:MAG: transglycosylase SLT domain-containing protein [Helicobacteraceae bacterium]|nr:transglycosylase SLT domain-containing protein [Helicobacteraceae bacterium]